MLNTIIQIILGIFLILIMAFIAYSIYDKEYYNSIQIVNTNKKETKIIKGILDCASDKDIRIETMNKDDPSYYDINPSLNQSGGAEYSYNFWLYFNIKKDLIVDNVNGNKYIVLFYKGVKQLIPYNQFDYSCDTKNKDETSKKYILVKNPLIKINNDASELIVEYNNINTPDTYNSSAIPLQCNNINNIYDNNKNKLGIKNINTRMYNKTFNMITVVMQESPVNEDILFSNRTNCKVYFNGSLVSDRSTNNNDIVNGSTNIISTVMKKNLANLYINPLSNFTDINTDYVDKINTFVETEGYGQSSPLKIADLNYYNYALSSTEIFGLYNKGFTNKPMVKISSTASEKYQIGKRINFDMYNSDEAKLPVESL
jgi:hypothetical protein